MKVELNLVAVQEALNGGIQAAAAWLAERMQEVVGIGAHSIVKNHREMIHSAPLTPPHRQSGAGQASIGWQRTNDGALVGVESIGTDNMLGENYMAGWDAEPGIRGARRPWLSLWERYEPEMTKIVTRYIKETTGAK